LFCGSLSFALAIAFVAAVPVNRLLIARGKGHAAVHRTGVHGGPSPRLVGTIVVLAFVFGSAVLIAEALDDDSRAQVQPTGLVEATR
jgi:UDP-N-acetylmuramyl pentapeptide phosphotransferase/UDP-N-acetylglucosamine-1-phosphate transferase